MFWKTQGVIIGNTIIGFLAVGLFLLILETVCIAIDNYKEGNNCKYRARKEVLIPAGYMEPSKGGFEVTKMCRRYGKTCLKRCEDYQKHR